MTDTETLPIAIIGAGPVGFAAAANLIDRGLSPLLFEAGAQIASSMRDWGHVRLFTPWSYLIDPVSESLLQTESDWENPSSEYVPLASEFVENYLEPIAKLDVFSSRILLNHRVTAVARVGHDRMKDGLREESPFLIVAQTPDGVRRFMVSAVIDASGTWTTPNPLGAAGVLADGEEEHRAHIRYGMPDILGREREKFSGKRVLVVGSGHSAIGSVLGLESLAEQEEGTRVAWAVRSEDPTRLWGGGAADEIAGRGALGERVHQAVHSGRISLLSGTSIRSIESSEEGLVVVDVNGQPLVVVDEIIVATGSRPDLSMLRELRIELDVPTESTKALGPLIDPNHHSCGSVPPHGAKELAHPEKDFYMVGMKSYGRAPTFLLRTGYEQVRSVVAKISGDDEAAARVELSLPQTGVCSSDLGVQGGRSQGRCC